MGEKSLHQQLEITFQSIYIHDDEYFTRRVTGGFFLIKSKTKLLVSLIFSLSKKMSCSLTNLKYAILRFQKLFSIIAFE